MLDKYFRAAYLDGQGKLTETEIKKEITLAWTIGGENPDFPHIGVKAPETASKYQYQKER